MCNKQYGERISELDVGEFDCLMPALGELFKTAENIRHFKNVSCGVHKHLLGSKDDILGLLKQIDENKMNGLSGSTQQIKSLINDLIKMKKSAIFSDKEMSNDIFQQIRKSVKY